MRPFRSRFVCRVLALALAGALGLTSAAPAVARATGSQSLRAVLDDGQAIDAALAAARDVPPADRRAAFAEVYAHAADDGTTAESVERLLGADSMSGVLPVAVERAVASASSPAPPALGVAALFATSGLAVPMERVAHADRQRTVSLRDVAPDSRPRAP